jgi:hypothetical protein
VCTQCAHIDITVSLTDFVQTVYEIVRCDPSFLLVLLRFKTATVQFGQESYGAYSLRPAAQLLSVHPEAKCR